MYEISRFEEYLALAKEPKRNKEIIQAKVANVFEPVKNLFRAIQEEKGVGSGLRALSSERQERQRLEREVHSLVADLSLSMQNLCDQVTQLLHDDPELHPQLALFKEPIEKYLAEGWQLHAGEISMSQVMAAVEGGFSQAPIFTDAGEATQLMRTDFQAETVADDLSVFGSQRDNVFNLDYFPAHDHRKLGRINFFSRDSGSILDEESGYVDDESTTIGVDFGDEMKFSELEVELGLRDSYYRKDTLATLVPKVIFKNGELIYKNVKPTNRDRVAALQVAIYKLKWMKYALENVGKEYYARVNLNAMLTAPGFQNLRQSVVSVNVEADPQTLQKKIEKQAPTPRGQGENNEPFFEF